MKEGARRSPFLADSAPIATRKVGIAVVNLDDPLFLEVDHDQSESGGHHAAGSRQPIDHPERLVPDIVLGSDRPLVSARDPFNVMFIEDAEPTEDGAGPLGIVTTGA